MYTAKNHTEGPDKLVIGGELEITEGAVLKVAGDVVDPKNIFVPDKLVIGGELEITEGAVLKVAGDVVDPKNIFVDAARYQSDSTVANLKADFNALLAKLRASGAMAATAPIISITLQPQDIVVTKGDVEGSLTVAGAASDGRAVTYQWYSSATNSNSGGNAVSGATAAEFAIPAAIETTTYYYCVVSATDAVAVASEAAKVTVEEGGGG